MKKIKPSRQDMKLLRGIRSKMERSLLNFSEARQICQFLRRGWTFVKVVERGDRKIPYISAVLSRGGHGVAYTIWTK